MEHRSQRTNVPRWVRLLVFVSLGAMLLSPGSPPKTVVAQEPATPLNIIVIKTDDQRWDTLWAMPMVQEELVRRGVNFANAFVSSPLCCPERASFLAGGFYAHHTGVLHNTAPNGGVAKFWDRDTLPVRLQRVGYRTAMIGKYLNGYPAISPYIPPGWTTFIHATGGWTTWLTYPATIGSSGPDVPDSGVDVQISQYLTDFLRDQAINCMREASASPFFIYLAPAAPHEPAIPAPGDDTGFANYLYRGRGYQEDDIIDQPHLQNPAQYNIVVQDEFHRQQLRSLQAVDRAVGALVQELKALGKLDQTLLIFMSDNGYLWGEHWQVGKSLPYEEAIRVPLVVVMPGMRPRQDNHLVVANLDVPVTIFEAAGIPRTDTDGQSLVPLLREPTRAWRTEFLIEHYSVGGVHWLRTWAGLRTGQYKYVEYASGRKILFDLVVDGYELHNEIDNPAYQNIVQDLAEKLEVLKGLAIISPEPPRGKVSQSFALPLAAWGGTQPYTWAVVLGSLPPGLTLESGTGHIVGTPTRRGNFRVLMQVSDVSISPYSRQPQAHIRPFTFVIDP